MSFQSLEQSEDFQFLILSHLHTSDEIIRRGACNNDRHPVKDLIEVDEKPGPDVDQCP